jgi:hypothetical protein
MIHKILNIREHPFYKNSLQYKNKPELFIEFVKTFMDNFENNYKLCKEWTDDCNEKLMHLVNNTNSFLNLLQDGSLKISTPPTTEKFKKLI